MPAPLSLDLRLLFQRLAKEEGFGSLEAARRLLISAATSVAKVRAGQSLEPKKCGPPPGRGKLGPYRVFLLDLVEQDLDITLFELRDALAETQGVCPIGCMNSAAGDIRFPA